jgi:hypothetical protein
VRILYVYAVFAAASILLGAQCIVTQVTADASPTRRQRRREQAENHVFRRSDPGAKIKKVWFIRSESTSPREWREF